MNHLTRCRLRSIGARSVATKLNAAAQSDTATADPVELEKFRKLAPKWWRGNEFLALRNLNQLRVPFIVDTLRFRLPETRQSETAETSSLPLHDVTLLDVGCGGGILAEPLARLGGTVTGIDPVPEAIRAAQLHARTTFGTGEQPPQYRCCTIEQLSADPSNREAFDGVIASEVLEHVDHLARFLENTIGCIRPGGFLWLTTINQTLLSYLGTIVLAENILGLVPKGTHQYSKFIPPAALTLILDDYNCDVVKIHGMLLNPVTMRWSWIQDQSVNYALAAVKRT